MAGESAERGRAARRESPRCAHGEWSPAPDRPDPIAVLQAQAATRLQELVPIRKTSLRAVKKLTEHADGELRFRSVPPLLVPFRELFDAADRRDESEYVRELLDEYAANLEEDRRYLFQTYRFVDVARKVVGVRSVGTRAWVFLLVARDGKDPIVLRAKEAQASVLEPNLGASEFENHGERVVRGQRMDQAAADIFLSRQRSEGLDGKEHDFYVRQLWDWKASIDLSRMTCPGLHAYARAVTREPTGACPWFTRFG